MKRFLLVVLVLVQLPQLALAEDYEQKGLAIAIEADRRETGFQDYTAELKMILRNRNGQESVREISMKILEMERDGEKSLSIFHSPNDVKGTAFLTYSHKQGDDDQWLYLPALKRVKRISSSNKSGSFMGSEFSYEDLVSQEVEKYTYKWLRDEIYDGLESHVVERYPVDKRDSGYNRLVTWIDTAEKRTRKVEYYDRKNSHLKTLTFTDYKLYLDKFWRPSAMVMVNHQNNKSTTLHWSNYLFQTGLTERDFDKNSLKRAK